MSHALFLRPPDSTAPDPALPTIAVGRDEEGPWAWAHLDDTWTALDTASDGTISWPPAAGSALGGGHLFPSADGLSCEGVMAMPGAEPRPVLGSAVPATRYATQLTASRYPSGTDPSSLPASAWVAGPELTLGYALEPGGRLPKNQTSVAGVDVSQFVALSITSEDRLELGFTVDPTLVCVEQPAMICALTIVFSPFGASFAGTASATCADVSGSGEYLFKGQATQSQLATLEAAAEAVLAEPRRPPAVPAIEAEAGPSIAELLSLVPDESVAELASEMLVEDTRWAIAQREDESSWGPELFGLQAPALPETRRRLISEDLSWYQDEFAVAYLAWAIDSTPAGAPGAGVRLDERQRQKLNGFLTVDLGGSTAYARQTEGIALEAYFAAKPRLAHYAADPAWGDRLLEALCSPAQLRLVANRIAISFDARPVGAYATLLRALEPSGALARTYQEQVLATVLLAASLRARVDDLDLTMGWLPDVLEAFVAAFEGGASAQGAEVAEAVARAAQEFGGYAALAAALADFYIQHRGKGIAGQSEAAAAAFTRAYPELAEAGRALFAVAWVGGMLNVVIALLDWDELEPEAKASAITNLVGLLDGAAAGVKGLFEAERSGAEWIELVEFAAGDEAIEDFLLVPRAFVGEDWPNVAAKATRAVFDEEGGAVVTAGTRWESVFAAADKVVAGIGVVVAAATAVFSTIDFVEDIRAGRPVSRTVLDGVLMAAGIAGAVTGTLGLLLGSTVFMLAGSVLAVLGAVIAIVELFLPEPARPSPAERFMRDRAIPFVEALPTHG